MKIGVVTTSIPERHKLLAENMASIRAQTLQPHRHVVSIDYDKEGPCSSLNSAVAGALQAGCDWIAQLADDDLADPEHLATLAEGARSSGAGIVYTFCRIVGRPGWGPPHINVEFDRAELWKRNFVPGTTLISRDVLEKIGGWAPAGPEFKQRVKPGEEWLFWRKALDAGFDFACVPVVTWTYRFLGGNLSWRGAS